MTDWIKETVDSDGNIGAHCSMVLDAANYPHIIYYDGVGYKIKYAYKDGTGWHFEFAADFKTIAETDIALDSNGYPHVVFYESVNKDLTYVYKDVDGWHLEKPDADGDTGQQPSIVLDELDYPHISYYDATANEVNYVYKDGDGWHVEPVATFSISHTVVQRSRIALGSDAYPRIAYTEYITLARVMFAYKDGLGWHTIQVSDWSPPELGRAYTGGMALDGDDYPHICYFWRDSANTKFQIRYSWQNEEGWHTEIVDEKTGGVWYMYFQNLQLGAGGFAHISYNAFRIGTSLQYLYYAKRGGADLWDVGAVEDSCYILNNDIRLVSGQYPHICYHDATGADRYLKYAYVEAVAANYVGFWLA